MRGRLRSWGMLAPIIVVALTTCTDDPSPPDNNVAPQSRPELSYYPAHLDFNSPGNPTPRAFEVWNSGTDTLDWSASKNVDWFDLSITSGSSTGEHDPITVTVDWSEVAPGQSLSSDITLNTNGGTQTVSVFASRDAPALITFASTRDGTLTELYVMHDDGSEVERVTFDSFSGEEEPSLSPDATKIVFSSGVDIVVIDVDGANRKVLTSPGEFPSWSPDGSHILFSSNVDGDLDIWRVNSDGSGLAQVTLTDGVHQERDPSYRADGQEIIFSDNNDGIWLMGPDASNARPLIDDPNWKEFGPSFSPDSKHVLFVRSTVCCSGDLWIADADGTDARAIETTAPRASWLCADWVVFQHLEGGNWEVSKKNIAGGPTINLTENVAWDGQPAAWCPR